MLEFILAVIIFAIDVYAIASIVRSTETTGVKVLWVLLVLILPVIGVIVWWFMGPKAPVT